jgi:hypothetical protein
MTVMFPYDPDGEFQCPKCGWPEGFVTEYSKIEWYVICDAYVSVFLTLLARTRIAT